MGRDTERILATGMVSLNTRCPLYVLSSELGPLETRVGESALWPQGPGRASGDAQRWADRVLEVVFVTCFRNVVHRKLYLMGGAVHSIRPAMIRELFGDLAAGPRSSGCQPHAVRHWASVLSKAEEFSTCLTFHGWDCPQGVRCCWPLGLWAQHRVCGCRLTGVLPATDTSASIYREGLCVALSPPPPPAWDSSPWLL